MNQGPTGIQHYTRNRVRMLSRHLWLQRPVMALQPMVGGLDKKKKKFKIYNDY